MVSLEEPCAIATAKELWEAIRQILVKYGAKPAETKNVQGIIIFAFTDLEKGDCTMLGRCQVRSAIETLIKQMIEEGKAVVIPIG